MRTWIVICLLLLTSYTWAAAPEGDCLVNYLGAALDSPAGKELIAAYRVEIATTDPNEKMNGRGFHLDFTGGSLRSLSFTLVENAHLPTIGVWSGPLPFGLRPTDSAELLTRRFGKPREDYTSSGMNIYNAIWEYKGFDLNVVSALPMQSGRMRSLRIERGRGGAPIPTPGCSTTPLVAAAVRPPSRPPAVVPPSPPRQAAQRVRIGQFESDPGAPPLAITAGRDDYGPIADIDTSCQGFYDQTLAAIGCIAPETGRGDAPFSIKQHGLQPARVWCGQSVPAGYWVQYGRNLYVYGSAKGSKAPSCRKIPNAPRPTISPNYQHCSHGVLCNGKCCEYPYFCRRNGPGIGAGESCL